MVQININGINREMTAEEQAEYNQIQAVFNATIERNNCDATNEHNNRV